MYQRSPARGLAFRLRQLWRDEALRLSPVWLLITALNVSAVTGVLVFAAARDSSEVSPTAMLIVLWAGLAVFLAGGRGRARCSRLDQALPLSARELWVSHLGATFLSGVVALSVSIGVVAAHERLLDRDLGWRGLVGPLTAGLLLVAVVLQSYARELREPRRSRFNLALVISLAGVGAVLVALSEWPLVAMGATLLPAIAIALGTLNSLPPAFLAVPREPEQAPDTDSGPEAGAEGARRPGWLTLFSILHHVPPWGTAMPWALYAWVALIGLVMAGGLALFTDYADEPVLRLFYLPAASYGLFAGIGNLVYQGFRLDPLPVSRERLFALTMLPTLLVFLVAFAGVRLALVARPDPQIVNYRVQGDYYWVAVPLRFLSISRDGHVPEIEAPWGESHLAWSEPLSKGSEVLLYSPFNTAEESSARFEAFLLSRAIEAIYGRRIPHDELLGRYFLIGEDGSIGLREGGLSLAADYPGLEAPSDGPEAPLLIALVVAPWLLLSALFFRAFRAPSSERRVKRVYWAIVLLFVAAMLLLVAGMVTGIYEPEVVTALLGMGIRRLGQSSFSIAATWLAAAAVVWGAYLLAQRQFRRCEFPAKPIQIALIDFAPGDS